MREIEGMQNQELNQETAEQVSLREKLKDVWKPESPLPRLEGDQSVEIEIVDNGILFVAPEELDRANGIRVTHHGH
jgi:hypothetical protein